MHHVSIVNDWFDLKKLTKYQILKKRKFLDAPGGVGNKGGRRDSLEAIKFVDELDDLQVLVVDDYDRQDAKSSVDGILKTRKNQTTKFIINYADTNQLLIVFFNKEKAEKFEKLFSSISFDNILLSHY